MYKWYVQEYFHKGCEDMAVIHATKEQFDEIVLQSEVPVLVDFWASWCGPCRMVAPVMDQLAEAYEGRAKIVKVDIDKEGELAVEHAVMSIPTVFIFKNGEKVDQAVGAFPQTHYEDMLDKQL